MKRSWIVFWDNRNSSGLNSVWAVSCLLATCGHNQRSACLDRLHRLTLNVNRRPVTFQRPLYLKTCCALNSTMIYPTSCTHVALKRNVDVFTLTQQYHNLNKATRRNQTWSCIVICCSDELKNKKQKQNQSFVVSKYTCKNCANCIS